MAKKLSTDELRSMVSEAVDRTVSEMDGFTTVENAEEDEEEPEVTTLLADIIGAHSDLNATMLADEPEPLLRELSEEFVPGLSMNANSEEIRKQAGVVANSDSYNPGLYNPSENAGHSANSSGSDDADDYSPGVGR